MIESILLGCLGGLSPRGRGKPCTRSPIRYGTRSIPAWAGETPARSPSLGSRQVYPRVGGGNARRIRAGRCQKGLSPRGRGKRTHAALHIHRQRSIPAWAGETMAISTTRHMPPVYPRVGGGNRSSALKSDFERGLSPRGRGKPSVASDTVLTAGSIPAWAGETRLFGSACARCSVYPRVGGGNAPA